MPCEQGLGERRKRTDQRQQAAESGPAGTNIYASTEEGEEGTFGPPVLVAELNTASDDQRPNVRRDGLEIFFDSNRSARQD